MGEAMVPMRTSTATAEMSLPGGPASAAAPIVRARAVKRLAPSPTPMSVHTTRSTLMTDIRVLTANTIMKPLAQVNARMAPENWDCVLKIRRTSIGTKNRPAATPVSMKPAPEGRGDVSRSLRIGTIMPNMGTRQIMRLAVKKPTRRS